MSQNGDSQAKLQNLENNQKEKNEQQIEANTNELLSQHDEQRHNNGGDEMEVQMKDEENKEEEEKEEEEEEEEEKEKEKGDKDEKEDNDEPVKESNQVAPSEDPPAKEEEEEEVKGDKNEKEDNDEPVKESNQVVPSEDLPAKEEEEEELEQEVRYRDTVRWSVNILEQSVEELEAQLEGLHNEEEEEESEFKLRFESQRDLNSKLEEQIKWYNQEVMKMRDRNKRGNEYNYDADLEAMNEFDLAKLVKQLERKRNNLYGDLRNKSWLLDNQSKEYYHYKELIKAYTGDLNHINRSLEQIWRHRSKSRESGIYSGMTPMTSPGSMNWSGESGIRPSHRILDPRKGPVRKTAGVRSLPRLDQKTLEEYDTADLGKKKRTKSMSQPRNRTKSLEVKRRERVIKKSVPLGHRSADELERDTINVSASTSFEPTSDPPSDDLTIESFTSSVI